MKDIKVFVTLDFVGFHRWPSAPDRFSYLGFSHRHVFKVRAELSVTEMDREVEFIDLKRHLTQFVRSEFENTFDDPLSLSCEQIADRILEHLKALYPDRGFYSVSVSEDGENGATVKEVIGG